MSKNIRKLEFFYDVVSPYSFIGFEIITRLRDVWKVNVVLKPFFLGGIMKGAENKPPALVSPAKGRYLPKDVQRIGKHYKIPVKINHEHFAKVAFEKGTINSMRFITAIDMIAPSFTEKLSRHFFLSFFVDNKDITEPNIMMQVGKDAGLNNDQIQKALADYKTQPVKDRLAAMTKLALDHDAFGAPTIIVHDASGKNHMIFGSDRWEVIADLLGEKYQGPYNELSKL